MDRRGLRLDAPTADPDPLPRAAQVGPGSAYAAVREAVLVAPDALSIGDAVELPARRIRALRTWDFSAAPGTSPDAPPPAGAAARPVAVPDCWSRRDPALADFRGPAWYRRSVEAAGPHARLVFDGLDYVARIHLDGALAAAHEGGFTPVAVDLPAGRAVDVAVCLDDPAEAGLDVESPLLQPKRKVKGVQEWHDSRPGGIAAGPAFDPTWIRRWGTGGITGDAWLHETGAVRIEAFFVTARRGRLALNWVLRNLGAPCAAGLVATVDGCSVLARAALPAGASRVAVQCAVEGERPWHPDSPALYRVRAGAVINGEVSDTCDATVGFREVRMETGGERAYHLHLDGRPVYVRAANWIGGVWPPELSAETVEEDVRLARAANLNSLGVHAGVCAALPAAADRHGLLVYQDFPLQWSYDPDGGPLFDGGPGFSAASLQLAAEMVYRLYNHPSIVYWCGHNEPAYQLLEAFRQAATPELQPLIDLMAGCPDESALDERRAALLAHLDPTRPSFAASGLGASRDEGDVHCYGGSLSGGSATDSQAGRRAFVSEYGAWSANFSASVRTARGDWPPPPGYGRIWHEQTQLPAVQDTFAGRPDRYADFATWCFAGQLWSGWHAKVVTEKARLAKWRPSGGQRWHFLVDHFGDGGAGVLDRHRTTGPAYRGLRAANRPLTALAPFPSHGRVRPGEELVLPITLVSDLAEPREHVRLRWRVARLDGDGCFLVGRDDAVDLTFITDPAAPDHCAVIPRRPGLTLLEGECAVDAAAESAEVVAEVRWHAAETGAYALLLDVDGQVGWTSFVVQPDGWSPQPGLVGPTRFRVESELDLPLRDRWTGAEADPDAAPPGQYLLGAVPVDVFDDVHVDARGVVTESPLPW